MEIKESGSSRLHLQTAPLSKGVRLLFWSLALLPWLQLVLFLSIFPLLEKGFRLEKLDCEYQTNAQMNCQLDYFGIPLFGKTETVKFRQLNRAIFEENIGSKGSKTTQINLETDRGKFILFNQTEENNNLINNFIADKQSDPLTIIQDNRRDGLIILTAFSIGTVVTTIIILSFIPYQYSFVFDKSSGDFDKITYCLGKTWYKKSKIRDIVDIKIDKYRIKSLILFLPFVYLKSGKKIRIDLNIIYANKNIFVPVSSEEVKKEANKIAKLISDFVGLDRY